MLPCNSATRNDVDDDPAPQQKVARSFCSRRIVAEKDEAQAAHFHSRRVAQACRSTVLNNELGEEEGEGGRASPSSLFAFLSLSLSLLLLCCCGGGAAASSSSSVAVAVAVGG